MKRFNGSARRRRKHINSKRRAQLLAAFDQSGLSAADFARQQGIHYATFWGWRRRQVKAVSPDFVEVELAAAPAPVELLIELGAPARLRLTSPAQIELAAQLLHRLNAPSPC